MALHSRRSALLSATWVAICLAPRLVLAQNGDGGAATGNVPGQSTVTGGQGPDRSSANISTGATIAIAIIVGMVVVLGVTTAFLFLSAKRRQWTMREQLRHSRRRVTTGLKAIAAPLTPGRGILSPVKTRFTVKETGGIRDPSPLPPQAKVSRNFSRKARYTQDEETDALRGRDLEKGTTTFSTANIGSTSRPETSDSAEKSKNKRQDMMISIPKPGARITEPPKTPMWDKVLGRT